MNLEVCECVYASHVRPKITHQLFFEHQNTNIHFIHYSVRAEAAWDLHLCQINHLANKHIKAYHTEFRIAAKHAEWEATPCSHTYHNNRLTAALINGAMLQNQQYDMYITGTVSVNAEQPRKNVFFCIFRRGRVKLGHFNSTF